MRYNFENIFTKNSFETSNGDYFYQSPCLNSEDYLLADDCDNTIKKENCLSKNDNINHNEFMASFTSRNLKKSYIEGKDMIFQRFVQGNNADTRIIDMLYHIANNETPFLELGSDEQMGLAPYILQLNANTPCLIATINNNTINRLRSRINENISDYNIHLASFDPINIPIEDNSIMFVTGVRPMSDIFLERPVDGCTAYCSFETLQKKALKEVYRILKPGGCYIFAEYMGGNFIYNLNMLDEYFETHNTLYGLYTKNDLYATLLRHKEEERLSLNDEKLKEIGFEIEIKKTYSYKERPEQMPFWFSKDGSPKVVDNIANEDNIIQLEFTEAMYVLRKPI